MKYALNFETEALGDTAEFDQFAEESTNSFWELDEYSVHECESCSEFDPEYDESEWEAEVMRGRRVPQRPLRTRPNRIRPGIRHPRFRPRVIRRPGQVIAGPSVCTCPAPNCPRHGSEYVRWVQSALNQIMNLQLPVTGFMNAPTRSALRSFQEKQGLPVDGIAGPETRDALLAAKGGKSPGAGGKKPAEPGIMEPAEPTAPTPPAEFEFVWEVAPLGQRKTQRLTYSGQDIRFPSGEILRVVTGLPIGEHEDYWDPKGSGNPLLDTGPAHKDKKLSTSFTVRELTTSGGVSVDIARIDPKLVECLQRLRDHVGKGVKINSGFRSWKRNRDVYKKRGETPTMSEHCGGRAADIKIAGMNGLEIGKAAIDACGPNIGVGLAKDLAHIDVRGVAAAWNYGGVKDSLVDEIKRYQKEKGGSSRKPSTAGVKPRPGAAKPPAELVRFAQRVLNATEGERLDDDGDLGRLTRDALAHFRTRYGLGPGGVLDEPTELALVQRAIEELAQQSIFPQIGVLDAKTGPAIARFKSERGLGFDATIDAATRRTLADALVRRTAPTPTAPAPSPSGSLTPPTDPSAYRRFRLTTYHVVDQRDVPTGAVRVPIYDDQGRKLAQGSPAFFAQLSLEGAGRLEDGRLINVTGKKVRVLHDDYGEVFAYHRRNLPGKPPLYSGIVVENDRVVQALAFHEVPAEKRGIGYGVQRGIPLVPFRTLAADIGRTKKSEPSWKGKGGLVPPGTRVYIREYDGVRLPDGTRHDGWFVVNDTGGGIFGVHFDVFVGTRTLGKQLKHPAVGTVWFPGIEQRVPPRYDYGLKA